ncbi:type 3 dihydrofolate reductase [Azospira restricta]|uniref:Dihydrofolate reductase n=1 Tax=Azospira restricta TaxID=404405 RepID=A0A974Y575_9RHOO|nr:type 3 dihydrofolate reductase [Azospira restricta]QRJ65061.1 type 3 dihydrofolate reductase [Azospira restricta]
MTILSLIAAMDRERLIGRDNALPWHLPEDLRHFKTTTLGKPVIMGRKTWESLGRPLPGRRNIVVSRNAGYRADGGELATSLEAALALCADAEEAFVIGGAELYRQALPLAQRMYLTEVDGRHEGDAWFPDFPADQWRETAREAHVSAGGIGFAFVRYERR